MFYTQKMNASKKTHLVTTCLLVVFPQTFALAQDGQPAESFKKVATILRTRCLNCHNSEQSDGELSVQSLAKLRKGGYSGPAVEPGSVDKSYLVDMITSDDGEPAMPQDGEPLSADEVTTIKKWISEGAYWPKKEVLSLAPPIDLDWWSLKTLRRPNLPVVDKKLEDWAANPVDSFIARKLIEHGFSPAPPASKQQLIRRLYFDLIGLPPTPEEIDRFVQNEAPDAYERMVEQLLSSQQYGERWARHWLDLVQYADTHGYDKDKMRDNAWPYRDYVIEAFNQDKNYSRFVREQIAGDVLFPETIHGQVATGFLSAGPWDFIGHVEVPESKIDGKIARLLDRDDMVSTTMNTFVSTTVQCARCHHHKFDPIHQEHYYALHSVFAALDRADKGYDTDPAIAKKRSDLEKQLADVRARLNGKVGVEKFKAFEAALKKQGGNEGPEFGWHSDISITEDSPSWIQFEFQSPQALESIVLYPAYDDFNNIGAGFGFPVRFKVEASNDPEFKTGIVLIHDQTKKDIANPKLTPYEIHWESSEEFLFIRVTATKRFNRKSDFIFALAEVEFQFSANSTKPTLSPEMVSSSGSIEAPPRWSVKNLFDGNYPVSEKSLEKLAVANLLTEENKKKFFEKHSLADFDVSSVEELDEEVLAIALGMETNFLYGQYRQAVDSLATLPPQQRVYSATVHNGNGNFRGRAGLGPREIYVLKRGDVRTPGEIAKPGTIPIIAGQPWQFEKIDTEAQRRAALADWLVRKDNPLTWRSIVNRVWHYHFGQGIVSTPNDFGRMGATPTHPELLDWLAVEFRDGGDWVKHPQSIKDLHRLIVNSNVYKQAWVDNPEYSAKDKTNQYLWRMNLRQLDAESIRDSMLAISGKLKPKMYGPPFKNFVVEKPEHSPHYRYEKFDPDDPNAHRRSIYRFVVRSQQQPLMNSLNCADPNQRVAVRNQSNTVTQSLAMLNNKFVLSMSKHLADRLRNEQSELGKQISHGFKLVTGRGPNQSEYVALHAYALENGLEDTCRVLLNLNEFAFVD